MTDALPLVGIADITGPLRDRVDLVERLGGDLGFYRWAANAPQVTDFYWGDFYQRIFFGGRLPVRLKEIVRLRLAARTGCAFCASGDRASALANGLAAAEVDDAFAGRVDAFADERERAALRVAEAVADADPCAAQADLARLPAEEGVELAMVAGVLAGVGRMLLAAGFVPTSCPAPAPETT